MILGTKLEEITNARKGIRPTTQFDVPSLSDSLRKYTGTYTGLAPKTYESVSSASMSTESNAGIWEALKFSAFKGFVDYAADATDSVLSKLQEAKLGLQSSIEQITKKSSDPEKQKVFDQYNQDISKATTMQERQEARRKLAEKTQEWATERQYGVAAGEEAFASKTPKLAQARKDVQSFFEPKIADLARKADVENEGWFTQVVASAAESTPYTLASKLSLAGFFLNYGVQEQRSIQEKTMLAQLEGKELSLEDKQNILMNAVGGAVVEAASEHIFPAGAGALGKATVKSVAKFIVVQGLQEGAEEVLSYIGQGFIAKITTDPNATLFGIASSSGALINLEEAGKSALAGAIMGSVYSGVGGTTGYVKTKIASKKYADVKVENITSENVAEVEQAIREDAQDQDNVDELFADLSAATVKINQDLPIEKQAQNLETAVASLQEKSKNQVLQPAEKANTDAVIQVAQAELNNLYAQQKEAILQSPAQGAESPSSVEGTSISTPAVETPSQPSGEATQASAVETVSEPVSEKPKGKQKRQYYSLLTNAEGKPTPSPVDGKAIKLDGMPNTEFFVRKVPNGKQNSWSIVEATSGVAIVDRQSTRKTAVDEANSIVARLGADKILEKVNEFVNKYGSMPVEYADEIQDIAKRPEKPKEPPKITYVHGKTAADFVQKPQPKAEPKVAEERATASETIAKESQKQDMSGVEGIVAPVLASTFNSIPQPAKSKSWQDTISPETKQRFEESSTPIDKESLGDRIARYKEMFREYVTLGSVPIPVDMGDLRVEFRKMRTAFAQAKMKATRIIELSYNQVGKERFDLMSKSILYLDMMEDIRKGLYNQGSAMQFGIKSPQEAINTANAIVRELKKPENQVVVKALKTRKRMMDSIRNDLLVHARKAGVDLELINNRKDYMYHAIIAYQKDFNRMAKSKKGKRRIEYLGRTGSIQDYVSDPVFSDYIIIGKMVSDTYRLRLFNEIKKQDISSTLPQTKSGEYIVPEGYDEMDVSMLGMPKLSHYGKQEIIKNAAINLANMGIQQGTVEWEAAMKAAYAQANKTSVVVPDSIVTAIEYEFGKKERYVGRSMKFVMNAWKYSKLRLPNVVFRYNIRNFFGDLDAMVIGNPSAILNVPKAAKELYNFYYRKGVMTPALADFVERTGLVTGQTAQELKSLKSHSTFDFYEKSNKPADVVKRGIRKAWSVLTLETATDYREQILRYASYLTFLEQVQRSKTGTLKNYAMSIPKEIDSITDIKDKASKLANDMIGAYDDVSIFGQYASDHLMPFFRFKEINIKRYYRLTKNIFYTSPEILQDVGTGIARSLGRAGKVGAFTVMKAAKVAISVTLFYGALQLFNNLMSPDEEDQLPEDVKSRPHITLPSWLVGESRLYYIDRLGSLAELLDIFGIDRSIGSDLNDVITGRMKLEDKMKEMFMSPVHDIFNSSFPLAKMSVELMTGQELFPDPSNPRQIRDRWEYIFGQVGFKDEYKAISGKPIIEGSYTKQKRSILFTSVVPGEAAYWDVYDMQDDFYARYNKGQRSFGWKDPSSVDAKKANAAYYYKVALKMEDWKAAEKYLKEYVFYGGTQKTFEATMKSMAPLYGMSKSDQEKFLSELTEDEKKQYDKAVKYFNELQRIKATSLPEKP